MGIRGLISARAEKAALAVWRRGGILSTQPFERTAQLMDGSVMRQACAEAATMERRRGSSHPTTGWEIRLGADARMS